MIKKLMKVNEYENGSSVWRIACECDNPEHDVELYFEVEKDSPDKPYYMSLYMKVDPYYDSWIKRIKHAWSILVYGRCEIYGDVLIRHDGIEAMKTALDEGAKLIEERYTNEG